MTCTSVKVGIVNLSGHVKSLRLDGSVRCHVGDSEEECGTGTPARRGSVGGAAPASLQKSAIKLAPGLGSKRVSWDPSVCAPNDEVTILFTPDLLRQSLKCPEPSQS